MPFLAPSLGAGIQASVSGLLLSLSPRLPPKYCRGGGSFVGLPPPFHVAVRRRREMCSL